MSSTGVTNKQTKKAMRRILKDKIQLEENKLNNIHVIWPDSDDLFHLYALIIGPKDTPYENGFFFFDLTFPKNYPFKSPHVEFITGDGYTRFNPNLYRKGKVCLSILGTWSGPSWTSSQNLSTVLLSIQSLLNEHPIVNEPGWEKYKNTSKSKRYNEVLFHQVMKVCVLDQLKLAIDSKKRGKIYKLFLPVMKKYLCDNLDWYIYKLNEKCSEDGEKVRSGIFNMEIVYKFKKILNGILDIYHNLNPTEILLSPEELELML